MTKEELNQLQILRRNFVATHAASGHAVSDHLRGITKMVEPGNDRRAAP